MKKTALAILILLLMINVVSACENPNADIAVNPLIRTYFEVGFISSYALIIPIAVLYFLRKRIGMWTIISGLISLVLFIPLIIYSTILDACGGNSFYGLIIVTAEFAFMLFLFTFQVISWITQRSRLKTELP